MHLIKILPNLQNKGDCQTIDFNQAWQIGKGKKHLKLKPSLNALY